MFHVKITAYRLEENGQFAHYLGVLIEALQDEMGRYE